MDFSQEELLEAVERLVAGMLERAGATAPPIDALALAERHLGIPLEWVEPADDDDDGRRRPRPRAGGSGIALTTDMSAEQRQRAAADGVARHLLPDVYRKLGVVPGSESKQFAAHVRALVLARVLIPTRLLRAALRDCKYDVPALHAVFRTASIEAVAGRLLDLDSPCVIAVVDDDVVASRRSNFAPVGRKLEAAERECVEQVTALDLPHRARVGEWTAWGWPVPGRPFRRILLRAVRDDV
ncbi:MAG: hypothetical protein FJ304_20690 [Planctomycetes bacterium]|nr:hypothetical protein [Planctomycetota bacterium]